MAEWTKIESPHYSDTDDTYDIETNNMCSDEPMDLKQVNFEPNHSQENASNDWDTSKFVKSKAFRIKDILGLDEAEKLAKAPSTVQDSVTALAKSSTTSSMCYCLNFTENHFVSLYGK